MPAITHTSAAQLPVAASRPARGETARRNVVRVWREEPLLAGVALLMAAITLPSAAGLWLDPRVITGAPAWLKPTKFAISAAIYTGTLAWVLTTIPTWRRTRRVIAWVTAVVLPVEVAIIGLQAWRGTASHFNVSTPLDGVLFSIMGLAILVQTVTSVAVAVALWRQHFDDAAMGWALRLGMTLTIVGALSGGLMTQPTTAQLANAKAGQPLVRAGAHTVGGPDGGRGLPVTGWSTEYGDLRVPHFIGLHAIQVLPLVAMAIGRRRRENAIGTRLMIGAAATYGLVFVALLVQALRGLPLGGGL